MTLTPLPPEHPVFSDPSAKLRALYEVGLQMQVLDAELDSLADMLDDQDPEVVEQAMADIEALVRARSENGDALLNNIDQLLTIADLLLTQSIGRKDMAKRLESLAKADEAKLERLQSIAIKVATTLAPGAKHIDLEMHRLQSRKSTAMQTDEDFDPEKLPRDLQRVKIEPDKQAIKVRLRNGGKVKGCTLVERTNWTIR